MYILRFTQEMLLNLGDLTLTVDLSIFLSWFYKWNKSDHI